MYDAFRAAMRCGEGEVCVPPCRDWHWHIQEEWLTEGEDYPCYAHDKDAIINIHVLSVLVMYGRAERVPGVGGGGAGNLCMAGPCLMPRGWVLVGALLIMIQRNR